MTQQSPDEVEEGVVHGHAIGGLEDGLGGAKLEDIGADEEANVVRRPKV